MDKEQLIQHLVERPSYLKWGNIELSRRYKLDIYTVKECKMKARKILAEAEADLIKNITTAHEAFGLEPKKKKKKKYKKKKKGAVTEYIDTEAEVIIPKSAKNHFTTPGLHIVLGCVHAPFHNETLLKGIMKLGKDLGDSAVGLHLIGDFLDLNALSAHDKGRFAAIPGLTLDAEYHIGNKLLNKLDKAYKSAVDKSYIYGNHEHRYFRYMADMENAKRPLISPTQALSLERRGYHVHEAWDKDYVTLGNNLDLMHGIYFNVHCAKKHTDVFRTSAMFAHTHRVQTYIEGQVGGYNIGSCADFNSKAFGYATRAMKSQWRNAFGIVQLDNKGRHFVTTIVADEDGHFWYNNKKY